MKSSEDKKHQELQEHDHGESEEEEEAEVEDQPHPLPILTDSKPKFQPFKLKSLKIAKGFEFEDKIALIGPVLEKFETRFSPIKETYVYTKRLPGNPPFGFEQEEALIVAEEEALVAEEEETRNVLQPVGARTEHKHSEQSVRARLGSQFERGTGDAPGRSARIYEKLNVTAGDLEAENNNFDRAVEAVSEEALKLDPELQSAIREAGDARAKSSKLKQGGKEDGPTKR